MSNIIRAMADAVRSLDDATLVKLAVAFDGPRKTTATTAGPRPPKKARERRPAVGRLTGADARETLDSIERFVGERDGVSAREIAAGTGIDRGRLDKCLLVLRQEQRVFMGGDRRFARYATSRDVAERATKAARVGFNASWKVGIVGAPS